MKNRRGGGNTNNWTWNFSIFFLRKRIGGSSAQKGYGISGTAFGIEWEVGDALQLTRAYVTRAPGGSQYRSPLFPSHLPRVLPPPRLFVLQHINSGQLELYKPNGIYAFREACRPSCVNLFGWSRSKRAAFVDDEILKKPKVRRQKSKEERFLAGVAFITHF